MCGGRARDLGSVLAIELVAADLDGLVEPAGPVRRHVVGMIVGGGGGQIAQWAGSDQPREADRTMPGAPVSCPVGLVDLLPTVLELAARLTVPARERSLGRFDFFAADEAFLTGTGAGIVPIRSLDSRPVGGGAPGPITEKVPAAFAAATHALGTPV